MAELWIKLANGCGAECGCQFEYLMLRYKDKNHALFQRKRSKDPVTDAAGESAIRKQLEVYGDISSKVPDDYVEWAWHIDDERAAGILKELRLDNTVQR